MGESAPKSYVGIALGIWAAQGILTAFGWMNTFMEAFSGDSCGTGNLCNFDAFWAASNTYYVGSLVLLAVSLVGLFLLQFRGRLALLPPVFGTAAVLVLLVATYAAQRAAFQLPFYGNRV